MSRTREKWVEFSGDEELLFADGYDDAIIGVTTDGIVCYDYDAILDILKITMPHEEAEEFLNFNVIGAYVGERTPIYIRLNHG